eukprot:gnl/MRDRNA2_/MRDRNA2_84435_c0_seq1.p1 gnl/MRDRNA2_/MRDRNA2_84435_c0~~gnl/MRDRNA2_/MRDRNA2_84435_c0_seq1.p1  ORF type:complete len:431 (+),score=102.74 gnl/MRDRNA2_/MRDRNA2_84435_c0_seq1:98-1390(+)
MMKIVMVGVAAVSAARVRRGVHEHKDAEPYVQELTNFMNTQYTGDFVIGGQHMAGIFDTGSFELLLRSTKCAACKHPTPPYNSDKSPTFEKNGSVVQHVFGSGPCISESGYDDVQVGNMVAKHQHIWEITQHKIPVLDQAKFAAIVGIGPHFAPGNSEKTLLMNYGVDEFSMCLERGSGNPGHLTWGPPPASKKTSMATVPVEGKLHWAAKMSSIGFDKKETSFLQSKNQKVVSVNPCANGCAAIIDSGTSLIAAPTAALMQLSEQVGPIHEDCSNLHELPMLKFTLGDKHFELPPHAYVMRIQGAVMQANNIWDVLFFKPQLKKVNMCIPAFMQIDMNSQMGPVWIMGMPFFRYYHTSFDRTNKQMHFGSAGNKCELMPHSSNKTALLSMGVNRAEDFDPTDIDIDAIIPPTLSSMLEPQGKTSGVVEV